MSYSIKILSNDEFDSLPYGKVGMALGVADPKTNTAYIRHSAHSELNKYLIDHEFEHLVEEIPTDEIDGVRYKIPLLGGLSKGIGSLFSGASNLIGKGASGLYNAGKGVASGIGGLASKAGSGVMNLFGKGGTGGGGGASFGSPIGSPISTTGNTMGDPLGGFNVGYGRNVNQSSPFSKGFRSSTNIKQGQGYGSYAGEQLGESAGGILESFFKPNTLLGLGSLGLGLMKKYPKVPELPPSVEELRGKISSGGSPLGQQAQGVLSSQLGQQYNALSEPEIDAALRQLEKDQVLAEDRVRDLYRNLRPGSDPSSDTSFRRDLQEVQDQFARAKADTLATRTRETKAIFDQQKAQQIQQALGASESEMRQLAQIAQLDINQIMAQLSLDAQQAQTFKDTFLDLGASLLNPQPVFSLFGGDDGD